MDIGQGAKKGHIFGPLLPFGLSAINQYFLIKLFPHRVNLPAPSNFSIRLHTVITTHCAEKKLTLDTFNDISQLIVHCAVMPSVAKLSVLQLDYMQLRYLRCSETLCS